MGNAYVMVVLGIILAKGVGFFRELFFSGTFGTSAEVDIYFSISIAAILSTGIALAYEYLANRSAFKGTPKQNNNVKQSKKENINHGRNKNQ